MSWFWTFVFLTFFANFNPLIAKHHTKNHSPTILVGTVFCYTCSRRHPLSGASVNVKCKNVNFEKEVLTNRHGEFSVRLPFQVEKGSRKIDVCAVELRRSNSAECALPAAAPHNSSTLKLRSKKNGVHVYSVGLLAFRPQSCDRLKTLGDPTLLPPLPSLPKLPPLPSLPGIPYLPPTKNKEAATMEDGNGNQPEQFGFPFPPNPLNPPSLFPPNPLQPPPSLFPPIFPSPPPSLLPPIFPSPPPPTFPPIFPPIQFPPIPGLVPPPSPPPPRAPTFPIPLPPFPFQPTPGFPGVPPPKSKAKSP